jgi:hypothetical protein
MKLLILFMMFILVGCEINSSRSPCQDVAFLATKDPQACPDSRHNQFATANTIICRCR